MAKATNVDIGCGTRKKEGYIGIDIHGYEGVDIVQDLRMTKLPFEDKSVEKVYSSHFNEHLTFEENIFLFNEVYRILRVDGIFEVIVPHGMSYAGMADLSHKTFWTEDTFGYFTPENIYYYDWQLTDGTKLINKWSIISNDATPKYTYTKEGFLENKLREIHAYLLKLP